MGEWQSTTLGALSDIGGGSIQTGPFGSQLHASAYVDEGVPIVMPLNIGDNRIDESTTLAQASFEDAQRLEHHRLEAGDIVYSRRGDVERRALVRPEQEGWLCGTGCLRVRLGDPQLVDSTFVSYLLGAPWVREWIVQHAVGATMLNLNTKILSSVPLIVPAVEEQRAIAEVLGALDDKIAANRKLADIASRLAQLKFEHATRHQPSTSINAVLEPILGGTPLRSDPSYWGGENLWISAKDVTNAPSSVVLDTEEKITDHAVASTKAKPLPRGSVIVTARGTVGKVARLGRPASFNQSCYGFRPDSLPPGVLYLSIVNAMHRALSFAHGSVFSTITKKTFDYLEIPSFESEELPVVEQMVAPLLDTVEAAMRENNSLEATRDALLPALMSGKLRVKDAERQVEAVV